MEINNSRIGFLGYGNMAQAMAAGWVRKMNIAPEQIYASARNQEKLQNNADALGIQAVSSNEELVEQADVIILAVKPHQIEEVIAPLKDLLKGKIVLSVAVHFTYEKLKAILPENTGFMSLLPNTPVSVGEGIVLAENKYHLSEKEYQLVETLLNDLGLFLPIATEQLSVAGVLTGSGPAFASIFIEALSDGAVKYGLERKDAYKLASQMIVGTGKMQIETELHPGELKDQVSSPNGTTIQGVAALEKNGFRHATISAFDAIEGSK